MQCIARLVNDTEGEWKLPFEKEQTFFHLPIRCSTIAQGTSDLCVKCQQRELRTQQKVAALAGKHSIQASHPALLHGRIGGPIPFWSHVYDGAWFRLKIEQGSTVSESNMAKAKKAAVLPAGAEPEPIPGGVTKKGRKKKEEPLEQTSVKQFLTTPKTVEPVSPPVVVEQPTPLPKKRAPKKILSPDLTPLAKVETEHSLLVEETIHVHVKKLEVHGRSYYLDPKKEKVYNLQFKYVGRYDKINETIVTGFHDSDQE